jgi:hypothetical protein
MGALRRLGSWLGVYRTVEDVFTMAPEPSSFTYVDRSQLDRKVKLVLAGRQHVAIHGQSKLGKSWLRAKALPKKKKVARVQCLPGMSASTAIEQALGSLGVEEVISVTVESSTTKTTSGGGAIDYGAKVDFQRGKTTGKRKTLLRKPIGSGTDSLSWVAEKFKAKSSTPVFEDFHNLSTVDQFAMAYIIKALGEWEVPCVVIGIWTDTHLLKLYNGELDGRIVDVRLKWTFEELRMVVIRGCKALKVEMTDGMIDTLVRSAYTSVGLLQELCAATLDAAGVRRRRYSVQRLEDMDAVAVGTERVVEQIASRYEPFMQKLGEVEAQAGRPDFNRDLVRAVVNRISEAKLLTGVDVDELVAIMITDDPDLERAQAVGSLRDLDESQRSAGIRPPILAYDEPRERLILVDRRLLLFLKMSPGS